MSQTHALVIGGTRGLGLATVKALARDGYRVSALGRSLSAQVLGEGMRFYTAELRDVEQTAQALQNIAAEQGPIRYLVFAQRFRGEGDTWAGELEVSLSATRRVIEALAERFTPTGDRAIAAVGSVYGSHVGDGQPIGYHVAKAGLEQLIRHYAFAWGSRGIRANVVAPCTYLKEESRQAVESNRPLMEMYAKLVPLGRIGTADDVADAIAFLCSPKAAYITGQTITVDGGLSMVWPETTARRLSNL